MGLDANRRRLLLRLCLRTTEALAASANALRDHGPFQLYPNPNPNPDPDPNPNPNPNSNPNPNPKPNQARQLAASMLQLNAAKRGDLDQLAARAAALPGAELLP